MYGLVTVNLNGPARDAGGELAIGQQIQRAFAERPFDHAGGLAAEPHRAHAREGLVVAASDLAADAGHRANEILDHAVGVGMVDVEAVELAIGRQVDAGLALRVEDHAGGVDARLLAGQRGEPVGDRIRADRGGQDCRRHAVNWSQSAL